MDHGELNHSFRLLRDDFVVAIEATRECQPREGAFNDPALWQDDELSSVATFDDLNRPGKHCRRPIDQFAGIAAIGKDFLNAGEGVSGILCKRGWVKGWPSVLRTG